MPDPVNCPQIPYEELQKFSLSRGWQRPAGDGPISIPVSFSVDALSKWERFDILVSYVLDLYILGKRDLPSFRFKAFLDGLTAEGLKDWVKSAELGLVKNILTHLQWDRFQHVIEQYAGINNSTLLNSPTSLAQDAYIDVLDASLWSELIETMDWSNLKSAIDKLDVENFFSLVYSLGLTHVQDFFKQMSLPIMRPIITSLGTYLKEVFVGLTLSDISKVQQARIRPILHQWNKACGNVFAFEMDAKLGPHDRGVVIVAASRSDGVSLRALTTYLYADTRSYLVRAYSYLNAHEPRLVESCGEAVSQEISQYMHTHELGHLFGLSHTHSMPTVADNITATGLPALSCSTMAYPQLLFPQQLFSEQYRSAGVFTDKGNCSHAIGYATKPGPSDMSLCQALYQEYAYDHNFWVKDRHSGAFLHPALYFSQWQQAMLMGLFRGVTQGFLSKLHARQATLISLHHVDLLTQVLTAGIFYSDAPVAFIFTVLQGFLPIWREKQDPIIWGLSHVPTALGFAGTVIAEARLRRFDELPVVDMLSHILLTLVATTGISLFFMLIGRVFGGLASKPVNGVIKVSEVIGERLGVLASSAARSTNGELTLLPVNRIKHD